MKSHQQNRIEIATAPGGNRLFDVGVGEEGSSSVCSISEAGGGEVGRGGGGERGGDSGKTSLCSTPSSSTFAGSKSSVTSVISTAD